MKREQLEKIARASVALVEALGAADVRGMTTSLYPSGAVRVTVHIDSDDGLAAIATALDARTDRTDSTASRGAWFLSAKAYLSDLTFTLIGPCHEGEARELDDAKVDAAVVQAEDAIGGAS